MNVDGHIQTVAPILQRHAHIEDLAALHDKLQTVITGTTRNELVLAVLGAFSRGKSTFINALLRAEVVPTSYLPATAVYTRISFDRKPYAILYRMGQAPQRVRLEQARKYVATETARVEGLESIHIFHPSSYLQAGLVILDAPGIGSVYAEHRAPALRCLSEADAAVYIMASEPLLGQAECEFVRTAVGEVGHMFFVQTKIDRHPDWEQRLKFNLDALETKAGVASPTIHPISSLRFQEALAAESPDPALLEKSGFPALERDLITFFQQDREPAVAGKRRALLRKTVTRLQRHLEPARAREKETLAVRRSGLATWRQTLQEQAGKFESADGLCRTVLDECVTSVPFLATKARNTALESYRRFVETTALHEIEGKVSAQMGALLESAGTEIRDGYKSLIRKTLHDLQSIWEVLPHNSDTLYLSSFSLARLPAGPYTKLAIQPVASTPSSSQGNIGGAIVGGVLGLLLSGFNPIGAVAGAALGNSINNSPQDKQKVEAAVRKAWQEVGERTVHKYIEDVRSQLDHEMTEWIRITRTAVRQQMDTARESSKQQIEQHITRLKHEERQIEERIKQLQQDVDCIKGIHMFLAGER